MNSFTPKFGHRIARNTGWTSVHVPFLPIGYKVELAITDSGVRSFRISGPNLPKKIFSTLSDAIKEIERAKNKEDNKNKKKYDDLTDNSENYEPLIGVAKIDTHSIMIFIFSEDEITLYDDISILEDLIRLLPENLNCYNEQVEELAGMGRGLLFDCNEGENPWSYFEESGSISENRFSRVDEIMTHLGALTI